MTRAWRGSLRTLSAAAAVTLTLGLAGCGGSGSHGTTRGAASPGASRSVAYGLGDAPGAFAECVATYPDCCVVARARCDADHMQGYFDSALFLKLTAPASTHRVRDVRLFVPWDAVEEFNGSTAHPGCVASRVSEHAWIAPAGYRVAAGEAIRQLLAGVIEARADGLQPLVTIAGYGFVSLRPPWDVPMPDPTTVAGHWALRCGLDGILDELDRLPSAARPHVWEPLNEPETFVIFRGSHATPASACTVGARPQPNGPAKAACVQALATRIIHGAAGHGDDTVIGGDFQHPFTSYLGPFVAELRHQLPGGEFPTTWSVHDYHEVTEAYSSARPADLAQFDVALARDTHGRARSLWITEAATVLSSTFRGGNCPAVGVDAAGSLGACLDGDPARQAASAATFFAMPSVAHAVPITHLFWYQLVGAPGWDSGLLDAAGAPRPVFCAFFGSGRCTGSPDAA